MRRSTLYKIGATAVLAVTAALTLTMCGGGTASFSLASTCADWNNASTSLKDSYVQNDASTANMSTDTFVAKVDALCQPSPTISLTGVLDVVSIQGFNN